MAVLLGVNIDHVATVRQARGTDYPSVIEAAELAERAGADSITIHLREDRRHIQDADVKALCANTRTRINLEKCSKLPCGVSRRMFAWCRKKGKS